MSRKLRSSGVSYRAHRARRARPLPPSFTLMGHARRAAMGNETRYSEPMDSVSRKESGIEGIPRSVRESSDDIRRERVIDSPSRLPRDARRSNSDFFKRATE